MCNMPLLTNKEIPNCREPGVYCLVNVVTKKIYIGSAVNIRGRCQYHQSFLRRNEHDNEYLQNAWNKYGEKAFQYGVVEVCTKEECLVREQYWIDKLDVCNRSKGYNMCPIAGNVMGGRKHSEESRKKMSRSQKGRDMTVPTQAAAKATRGKQRPTDVCAAISAAHTGKKFTDEHRAAVKANHWTKQPGARAIIEATAEKLRGRKHTAEMKQNISAGLRSSKKRVGRPTLNERLRSQYKKVFNNALKKIRRLSSSA